MKRILLLFSFLMPALLWAQEAEQSIPADSYRREGGTMIISFIVPKTDIPVNLQYNVKDVFFVTDGQAYRAQSVTGELQNLSPGKHSMYWEIGQDAPDLYNVEEINIVIRYTNDTFNQVENWKQRQQQQEQQRILNEIREQERRRIEDSIKQANYRKEKYERPKKEPKRESKKSGWRRPYPKTQWGIIGSLGTSFYADGSGDKSEMLAEDAYSWRVGLMYRSHPLSWIGLETGAIYSFQKFKKEKGSTHDFDAYSSVQFPLKGHLYLGKKLNIFAGYMYKYNTNTYVYDDSGDKENYADLLSKDNDELFKTWTGGWLYGAEWRSPHTLFSVTYQLDDENINVDSNTERFNGTVWLTYGIYF